VSVKETDTIDYITKSDDGSSISLTMVEDRPLDDPGVLDDTVAKINAYMAYLASGQLEEFDPDAKTANVRVRYNVLDDPEAAPELMGILRDAAAMFTKNGVEFVVRHFNFLAEEDLAD